MCGIVGYIGNKNSLTILINGLKRLEYRGYDSAGVGYINGNGLTVIKSVGKVSNLEDKVEKINEKPVIGIAHTRWATHGKVTETNAHPHINEDGTIAVIHNGIIENYKELKHFLSSLGYKFRSETDTEVLPHLIDYFYKKNLSFFDAVRHSLLLVEGTYGIVALNSKEHDKLIVARKGSPLVIGIGKDENFIASDVMALVNYTERVVYLGDNEIAEVSKDNIVTKTITNHEIEKEIKEIDLTLDDISKGDFDHYMLKEIFEQPASLDNSMKGRLIYEQGTAKLGGLESVIDKLINAKRIILCACGTSWHSALVGEYMLEQIAGIPVEVEYASEFRYRNPIIHKDDVIFFISQSGETADTLAALKEAKLHGATVLGICNVVSSSIARESDAGVYIHAGPEIGVASTKAFTSQLVVLALITLLLARKKKLSVREGQLFVNELLSLPEKINKILEQNDNILEIAKQFVNATNFLYLGRGYNFPVALEGALKLKEISYIHAEGYPAAEMKHGPIALIDENMPVVFIAPKDAIYEKIISNIEEVRARKGKIIAVTTDDDDKIESLADYVIKIPHTVDFLMPILTVIPLQLLAYHIAVLKGLNVDQPRNLAKSVTVE
ncbi:MAG TPA: glutamine--fructose-6-phosphate transaminase (isomerizing) [Ignavibacteriales bacterium]|nr:glutamine--fructose-6-phosphate transaminase (isomerizing) [Ignavibacteriales bacterium]HOM64948.1 glutamine--fructose-6-phosphate transaminase (isomerizing) [Ignavibacteriales bacterium]HPD67969.1 glutamine--fructose-6-phosphate transaminase (isomerizing) [Ignavibacteriales bacterium]HRR19337.1 glutamine--fructose-6-phosphate transaminase (isomerizing) [Ignavibacteriales bacterium]HRT99786.1 glutamine--fructose-6-phosphate transaminase (isomerizing) [Ignavibacteriales bacterium]